MLSRKFRLPSSEFRARSYRFAKVPGVSLKIKNNTLSYNRIGVVVGAAAIKNATQRNFLKRQVKSALATVDRKGFDILVVVSREAQSLTKKAFRENLLGVCLALLMKLKN